jgi:hypothetical protein
MRVAQLVAHASAFGHRDDEATATKAGQVVREARPACPPPVGQIGRIREAVTQCQEKPAPDRIAQRTPHAPQSVDVSLSSELHFA